MMLEQNEAATRQDVLDELTILGVDSSAFDSLSLVDLKKLATKLRQLVEAHSQQKKVGRPRIGAMPFLSATDKILKTLLSTNRRVSSLEIAKDLDIPLSTIQRRKRLESAFLESAYSLKVGKFGWKKVTLLISTENGKTSQIGKELAAWPHSIVSVARIMGKNSVDIMAECVIKDDASLLDLIEQIRSLDGVSDVLWNKLIEVIGKNPDHLIGLLDSYSK